MTAMQQQYGNNLMTPYSRDYSTFFSSNTNYSNPQGMNSNIIWVQGIEGAKALMLNPGAKVIFLDSEIENRAYIKIADELGATKLRKFELVEIVEEETSSKLSDYVRKDELQNLIMSLLPQTKVESEVENESTISTTQQLPTRRVVSTATTK